MAGTDVGSEFFAYLYGDLLERSFPSHEHRPIPKVLRSQGPTPAGTKAVVATAESLATRIATGDYPRVSLALSDFYGRILNPSLVPPVLTTPAQMQTSTPTTSYRQEINQDITTNNSP
jgi:hypothetical protein